MIHFPEREGKEDGRQREGRRDRNPDRDRERRVGSVWTTGGTSCCPDQGDSGLSWPNWPVSRSRARAFSLLSHALHCHLLEAQRSSPHVTIHAQAVEEPMCQA